MMFISPVALFYLYLDQLWIHLSVVQKSTHQQQTSSSSTINRTYLVTFVVFTCAAIHGTIGLHLEAGYPLTISSLNTSRFIYWRQIFQPEIWPQVDIALTVFLVCIAAMLLDFSLFKRLKAQHQLTIDSKDKRSVKLGGEDMTKYESTKLITMFRRSKIVYKLIGLSLFTVGNAYCYGMVFFVTKVYLTSFCTFSFWIFGFSLIFLLIILFAIINLVHIIVSGSCIQIRQQYLCGQFSSLMAELNRKRPSIDRFLIIWLHYGALNRSAISINLQLEAFNIFYTNYLTIIFFEYTVLQVLFSYVVFFTPAKDISMLILKGVFTMGVLEMATLLFGLINYCARVVVKNGQIGKLNRAFAVHCLRGQKRYRLRVGQLLKMDTLQWPRLLHFYAFKLFGDSRITSKTFYVMVIDISCFFLFVTKRMQ